MLNNPFLANNPTYKYTHSNQHHYPTHHYPTHHYPTHHYPPSTTITLATSTLHTPNHNYKTPLSNRTHNQQQLQPKKVKENPFLYSFPTRHMPVQQQSKYGSLGESKLLNWQKEEYINKYLNKNEQRPPQTKANDRAELQRHYSFHQDNEHSRQPPFKANQHEKYKRSSKPPNFPKESSSNHHQPISKLKTKHSYHQTNDPPIEKYDLKILADPMSQSNSFIRNLTNLEIKKMNSETGLHHEKELNQQRNHKFTDSKIYEVEPSNSYQHYKPIDSSNSYQHYKPIETNMYNDYAANKQRDYGVNPNQDNDRFDFNNKRDYQEKEYRPAKNYATNDYEERNHPYEAQGIGIIKDYPRQININNVVYQMIDLY